MKGKGGVDCDNRRVPDRDRREYVVQGKKLNFEIYLLLMSIRA